MIRCFLFDSSFTENRVCLSFELRLSDGVRSLTGINTDRGITQALVDQSISGSLGIIPIRITNIPIEASFPNPLFFFGFFTNLIYVDARLIRL